jgi:hypothetical protein
MRVLLVAHYALPHQGGIEVLVDREARILASAGHDVVILASAIGASERPDNPQVGRSGARLAGQSFRPPRTSRYPSPAPGWATRKRDLPSEPIGPNLVSIAKSRRAGGRAE